uniref:E3 ubiquitin-protein ligase RNF168 isoform X2 n=1 Tax=Jaculus jaculus TaxID=51337 RepID=UPI001E1B3053|nr:E3 ubiquitin-protein ligase RNF168 isoform X2 [Jaculus jaculus]
MQRNASLEFLGKNQRKSVEAERRANEEEENKASEEYIQKLLAEEEEEEKRQAEKRRSEMEEQMKHDEELARKLSININNVNEKSVLTSPLSSRKLDPVTNRSQKKNKNKQRYSGDIQKYLSPKSESGSTSQSEVVFEEDKHSTQEINNSEMKSPMCEDTEIEKDMPTLSPQIHLETQEQGTKFSAESPLPWLRAYESEQCLDEKAIKRSNNHDNEIYLVNHDKSKTKVPYSTEAAVKADGKTEIDYTVSGKTQITGDNTGPTENGESNLLTSNDIPKRKNQESSPESVTDPCFSAKKKKMFPKSASNHEGTEMSFTQKLIDLEHHLFERHKQEEQDRLLAFQLQKEADQELTVPNRQKGSPNEYQLRTASSPPDKRLNGQRKSSKDKNSIKQTKIEYSKAQRDTKDENWQPSFKIQLKRSVNGKKMPNSTRDNCKVSKSVHSLQPNNSQKSIFHMFQRYTK